jgi:hypothetical protein
MKRSEFVRKVYDIFSENDWKETPTYEHEIDDILKIAQSLGMLPPHNVTFDHSTSTGVYAEEYFWEPEDEL